MTVPKIPGVVLPPTAPPLVVDPEAVANLLFNTKANQLSDVDGECLEWQGTIANNGYAFKWKNGQNRLVHRLVFLYIHGYLPTVVRHKCDNPCCINPKHLLPGTHADNSKDMLERGREASGNRNGLNLHPESRSVGSNNGNSKLTENQVVEIRKLRSFGWTLHQLSTKFKISKAFLSRISRGEVWKHVTA